MAISMLQTDVVFCFTSRRGNSLPLVCAIGTTGPTKPTPMQEQHREKPPQKEPSIPLRCTTALGLPSREPITAPDRAVPHLARERLPVSPSVHRAEAPPLISIFPVAVVVTGPGAAVLREVNQDTRNGDGRALGNLAWNCDRRRRIRTTATLHRRLLRYREKCEWRFRGSVRVSAARTGLRSVTPWASLVAPAFLVRARGSHSTLPCAVLDWTCLSLSARSLLAGPTHCEVRLVRYARGRERWCTATSILSCRFRVANGHNGRDRPLELCAGASLLLLTAVAWTWLARCDGRCCKSGWWTVVRARARAHTRGTFLLVVVRSASAGSQPTALRTYVGDMRHALQQLILCRLIAIATVIGNRADRKKPWHRTVTYHAYVRALSHRHCHPRLHGPSSPHRASFLARHGDCEIRRRWPRCSRNRIRLERSSGSRPFEAWPAAQPASAQPTCSFRVRPFQSYPKG
ncbi:uncharacterized protein B0H18DRAFT_444719 [Fomitopsis serialis]|uniref:uncharacterized protein n=1 Tax=Fomitopsis serialis TaxID=139415 RepID=UPI0020088D91|nr:uncharacterized protein B0H18DRAFT_444719 [Neoantrodia serialis]KAH9924042.1 hypothetical protein B0H18DRAFT_444719 [Neoantrodia serialis]